MYIRETERAIDIEEKRYREKEAEKKYVRSRERKKYGERKNET